MSALPAYPYEPERQMGSVSSVFPSHVEISVSRAAAGDAKSLYGAKFGGGEVGEFVFIQGPTRAIFGKLTEIRLPEFDRRSLNSERSATDSVSPKAIVQVLSGYDFVSGKVSSGVEELPRVAALVFSAHPKLVKWMAEAGKIPEHVSLQMFRIPAAQNLLFSISAEDLFGRHLAVLGTTGGGKSWTLARMMEEVKQFRSKTILLDASGEFYKLNGQVRHVTLGEGNDRAQGAEAAAFPYRFLTENDLFAIFTPSGQVQAPKLRAAMKSLKVARIDPAITDNGIIRKAGNNRRPFDAVYRENAREIESPFAQFDVTKLATQVAEECCYPSGFNNPGVWGNATNEIGYCVTLINRIEDAVSNRSLSVLFDPGDRRPIPEVIDEFLRGDDRLLRISLQNVPFENHAREIVANAIGRYLLRRSREGLFRETGPCLVFVDEAHQFLNKKVGGEGQEYELDAFGLIAKEGRKYWLSICLATQRPRDIPSDVISQVGGMIVHRLINPYDRDLVERSAGEIDPAAAGQLPVLKQGEAVLIGSNLPFPLRVVVEPPLAEPDSAGPPFSIGWDDLT